MGWGYGRIYGGGGVRFVAILDLSWEMGSRSGFGMMCGVER
jgi:hypothetical protein